jgi:uroporphyrinogen III methyltransferase/synthase
VLSYKPGSKPGSSPAWVGFRQPPAAFVGTVVYCPRHPNTELATMNLPRPSAGIVYLIGAGSGDPKLLTLRGFELLQQADVVLYDYLVNPLIAAYASPSAELHCLGAHGRTRIWTQAEINERMVQEANSGRIVIRLKGGDPNIFGRLEEEVTALRQAEIDYEIVPGISAAAAASAYAGVPLTSRSCASAVAFVTGHELERQETAKLDFAALARFPGTLVVYMGVTTASVWVTELLRYGLGPQTPVALVRRCSLVDQQVVRCTLAEVPAKMTPPARFPPPVIAIVGAVAATASALPVERSRRLPLSSTR